MLASLRYGLVALTPAAALPVSPAGADSRDHEHDAERGAVERGEIRPLADILALVRGKLPGEIAGVEIERKNGRWVYEFRLVDGKGKLFEAYVDGQTGAIERIKEK